MKTLERKWQHGWSTLITSSQLNVLGDPSQRCCLQSQDHDHKITLPPHTFKIKPQHGATFSMHAGFFGVIQYATSYVNLIFTVWFLNLFLTCGTIRECIAPVQALTGSAPLSQSSTEATDIQALLVIASKRPENVFLFSWRFIYWPVFKFSTILDLYPPWKFQLILMNEEQTEQRTKEFWWDDMFLTFLNNSYHNI